MKKNRNYLSKAMIGEQDRLLDQILRRCGSHIGKKFPPGESKLIFIFGIADFGEGTWSAFTEYVIRKLKSLGHCIQFDDEWGTSKLSPCCHEELEFLPGDANGTRLKYCRHCHIVYNRDPMAAENMIYTWTETFKTGSRPERYTYEGR